MNRKILWITQTAVFIALLAAIQFVTSPLGNTLLTGSLVNLILVISVMLCGYPSGLTVAIISPVLAKFLNIGPLWELIPFIISGNISLITVWHLVGKRFHSKRFRYLLAAIAAAVSKFLVLYLGIVVIAVPLLLQLKNPQAGAISAMFSFPQLITALIGGGLAMLMLPVLKKAIKTAGQG